MQPVPPTVDKVLICAPFLLARHSYCGYELADLRHVVVNFERCGTHPMTGVRCLWMVLFRLLVELPFIFLANTLRSFLAPFLLLHG